MASRFVLPLADVGSGILPASGAQLFFFKNKTDDDKDTFTAPDELVSNANPVVADANGLFPDIFISGSYRVTLKDKDGVQKWSVDDVDAFGDGFSLTVKKFKPAITNGQTTITVPDAPDTLNLIINGEVQEENLGTSGSYTYASGLITLTSFSLSDTDAVEIQYGLIVASTAVTTDGFLSYASVSQMVLDSALASGNRVITYTYNSKSINFWEVSAIGNTLRGDVALDNGLFAIMQYQDVMDLEYFGAFGDGFNDDAASVRAAWQSGRPTQGRFGANYLLLSQNIMPSGLDFDGKQCNFDCNMVAGSATLQGRDWGVFQAIGTNDGVINTHSLVNDLELFAESIYPVTDTGAFNGLDDTFIQIQAGSLPDVSISYMMKYLGLNGSNAILDYRNGWKIPAGQTITYSRVTPVSNITLKNFSMKDISSATIDAEEITGISLGYAHDCYIDNVEGVEFRNPIIFTQYTTDCKVTRGKIARPQEVTAGKGYYLQWNTSLRCDSEVTGSQSRHLVDHTQCGYCNVSNSRDANSADGAFTNHGAYEHDISYTNCVGYHSIGNSGPSFGETCARFTITNGIGRFLKADRNIIDLSVYNSQFSFVQVNSQGFQADGLTVYQDIGDTTGFLMRSTTTALGRDVISTRPNVISNSTLVLRSGYFLTDFNFTGRTLYLNNCNIPISANNVIGTGAVSIDGGSWTLSNTSLILNSDSSLKMTGVDTSNFGVRHDTSSDGGYFICEGGFHDSIISTGFYSNRQTAGQGAKVEISKVTIDGGSGLIIDMPTISSATEVFMDISHNTFSNGEITIKSTYSNDGKLMFTNNLLDTITLDVNATAGRRVVTDNATV